MPTVVKPVIKTQEGARYIVDVGGYTTKVWFGKEAGGITPLNAEVSEGKEEKARLDGVLRGDEIAAFEHIYSSKGVSKGEGLLAIGALVASFEEVSRQLGVKMVRGRTHPTFARLLVEQMGYSKDGTGGGVVDIEKDIEQKGPKLPRVWDIKTRRG